MRYLTDTEILNWNKRLEKSPYMVRPRSHNRSGNVDIVFVHKVINGSSGFDLVDTTDPHISMNYLFSVASNRTKEFWDIFDRRKKVELGTKTSYNDKTDSIIFDGKIVKNKSETNHNIKEKEFTRFSYEFSGRLSSIISYITIIEDAVIFFQKMFGYNEDGSEVCLIKYPIGSVCSKKKNKSEDYVVLDYEYSIVFNEYRISYIISYMDYSANSSVIKYGDVEVANEDDLCFSRNNRIDNILEQ
jgi:hypothetical protein